MPRDRSRSPVSRKSRSASLDRRQPQEYRVHIADLPNNIDERELRSIFQRYGTLTDVWVATASGFGFVVYKHKNDGQEAIDHMDGRSIRNARLRVTWARPRTRHGPKRQDPNTRCYTCGRRGHFSRECKDIQKNARESHSRERSYRRSRSRSPIRMYAPRPLPIFPEMARYFPVHYSQLDRYDQRDSRQERHSRFEKSKYSRR